MNKLYPALLALSLALPLTLISHPTWAAEPPLALAEHHLQLRSVAAADLLTQVRQTASEASQFSLPPVTAEDALAALDIAEITEAIVISSAYVFSMPDLNPSAEYGLVMSENDFIAEQVAIAPNRLTGICSVNPLADYALDEIQRCAQRLGLKGVYLDFENSDIDLRNSTQIGTLATIFEFLEVLQFPALLHVGTRSPNYGSVDVKLFIDNVLSEAPTIDIQITHFASSGHYDESADRAMAEFIEAFADGRLEPSNFQFDLAEAVIAPKTDQSPQVQNRILDGHERLTRRIKQLDPQQVLFATGRQDNQAGFFDVEFISTNKRNITRLLSLTEPEITALFQTRSRLLN